MNSFLDVLFPPFCVSCGKFGKWWCSTCQDSVEVPRAHDVIGLDGFVALGMYHDPTLRAVVHGLKYQNGICLLPYLEFFVEKRLQEVVLPWMEHANIAIQHLPTDKYRERERGFDQAELIAKTISPFLHEKGVLLDALIRCDSRRAQVTLEDPALRQVNVQDVYRLRLRQLPDAIVLVDDVTTTGASMNEAARVLREGGVSKVYGFALAIGA
ncbi:ComF family protein [Candidatus Uhrbacteria bacterium]|nr:ComF family protein [Candidatus Uhrbacteria bacterium]